MMLFLWSSIQIHLFKNSESRGRVQEKKLEKEQGLMAERLQSLRKERGLTQEAFAEVLGVSRQGYARWEKGQLPEALAALLRLHEQWGIDLQWLLAGSERPDTENERLRQRILELETQQDQNAIKRESKPARSELMTMIEALATIEKMGPITTARLALELGYNEAQIEQVCRKLVRRQAIRRLESGWAFVEDSVLRADTDDELMALTDEVRTELEENIFPRLFMSRAAIALSEVRVNDPRPGKRLMGTVRQALEQLDDEQGRRLRVVICVALKDEAG